MENPPDILKFECYSKNKKTPIGEIIVPTRTLPSGELKIKWVCFKMN